MILNLTTDIDTQYTSVSQLMQRDWEKRIPWMKMVKSWETKLMPYRERSVNFKRLEQSFAAN